MFVIKIVVQLDYKNKYFPKYRNKETYFVFDKEIPCGNGMVGGHIPFL